MGVNDKNLLVFYLSSAQKVDRRIGRYIKRPKQEKKKKKKEKKGYLHILLIP